jgi:hypothetical protein
MFQMDPAALEGEVQRRRELAFSTMRAAHGTTFVERRVAGVTRVRHVIVALAAAIGA